MLTQTMGFCVGKAKQEVSENDRFWEPAGDFVEIAQCGKKSKLEEVFCGFACYPSEEVLLDARSQLDNQSPLMRRVGSIRQVKQKEQGGKRLSRAA
jgi:hypothetical protein